MINIACRVISLFLLLSCNNVSSNNIKNDGDVAIAKEDTCNNPDANINCCFINMPSDITNTMSMAKKDEPGERLVISGKVLKEDGKIPLKDVLMYAFQTNSKGYYTKIGQEKGVQKWHGNLHGWCKTSADGSYIIETIRPARYPDNSMPAHIHAAIRIPGGETFYISDFVFKDDSLVNDKYLKSINSMKGGTGIVDLIKREDGSWYGVRDIVLK